MAKRKSTRPKRQEEAIRHPRNLWGTVLAIGLGAIVVASIAALFVVNGLENQGLLWIIR
jgi:hypothetical protein